MSVKDRTKTGLLGVQRRLKKTGGIAEGTGKKIATGLGAIAVGGALLLAGGKIVGGAKALADVAGGFQASLAEIQTITGFTEETMGRLKDRALEIGIETPFGPLKAANAFGELARAGIESLEVMDQLAPAAINFAVASRGTVGLEEATGLLVGTMAAFKTQAKDIPKQLDVMARAITSTRFRFEDMGDFIGRTASVAGQFNQSMETVLAFGAAMKKAGVKTRRAAMNVRTAFTGVFSETGQRALQEELGLTTDQIKRLFVDQDTGKFRSMIDIFDGLNRVMERTPKFADNIVERNRLLMQIATKAGVQAFEMGRNFEFQGESGFQAMRKMITSWQEGKVTLNDFTEAFLKTWPGVKVLLEGTKEVLQTILGLSFAPIFAEWTSSLTHFLNRIARFLKANPDVTDAIAKVTLAVGAGLIAFGAFAVAIGIATLAVVGFQLVILPISATIWAIVAASVAAVAGLLFLGRLLFGSWGGFLEAMVDVWNGLKEGFAAVWEIFKPALTGMLDVLGMVSGESRDWGETMKWVGRVIGIILGAVIVPLIAGIGVIVIGLIALAKWIGNLVVKAFEAIKPFLEWINAWESLKTSGRFLFDMFMAGVEMIVDAVAGIIRWIGGVQETLTRLSDFLGSRGISVWGLLKEAAIGTLQGIIGWVGNTITKVLQFFGMSEEAANAFKNKMKSLFSFGDKVDLGFTIGGGSGMTAEQRVISGADNPQAALRRQIISQRASDLRASPAGQGLSLEQAVELVRAGRVRGEDENITIVKLELDGRQVAESVSKHQRRQDRRSASVAAPIQPPLEES